ncbi:MAG TPA: carboxypeptidase-like regulatory domain-containing protein [Candidatus Angelobacter sp.]|nr:carboxypeptidase-like regulatory domain-containing protein [Candidatus Angelobacter sp.]
MLWNRIVLIAFCWLVLASSLAAQISGTVTNGTTNKPASGNEVVLLSLDGGMNEVSRATTDSSGHFSIDVPDSSAPHLLRVNHQGVNYFTSVPPGASATDITIYNAAKQVEGVAEVARVFRMQAAQGQLEVSVGYTLRNESQPPRTMMDTQTFSVDLPEGAQLVETTATSAGGMPTTISPVSTGKKNNYAMSFPLRPGETRFQVTYKVPYSGAYEFNFTPDSQLSEVGVLLPKSMQFTGISRTFSQDSDEAGLAVFYIKNAPAHEQVRFSVAGEGLAPRNAQNGGEAALNAPASASPATEGGGEPTLNAPTSASSSTTSSPRTGAFWYVLAGIIVIVVGGGYLLWRWSANASRDQGRSTSAAKRKAAKARRAASPEPITNSQETMLDTLKDELFQLEQDRLEGNVSTEEYEKSKAGLDALIRRQLKKAGK